MAKHTAKALNSTRMVTPGSKHTSLARGRHQGSSSGNITKTSKRSKVALGHPSGGRSTGKGTSNMTNGLYGVSTRRYERRNTTGRPLSK